MMWATVNLFLPLLIPASVQSDSRFTSLDIDNIPCNAKNLKTSTRYICDASGQVTCLKGWRKGPHENKDRPCSEPICSQGCVNGECIRPDTCACNVGWMGKNCSTCISFPGCDHGKCNNKPLTCQCDDGYQGKLCDRPICSNCVNGICTSPNECTCFSGWSGANCTVCQDRSGCRNGNCTNSQGMQVGNGCFCEPGWKGALCDQPVCQQGCVNGECRSINNEPLCVCNKGWRGDNCTECVPHPGCPGACRTPWGCICDFNIATPICMEISNCNCNRFGSINPDICDVNGTCTCKPTSLGQKCDQAMIAPSSRTKNLGTIGSGQAVNYRIGCQGPCRDIIVSVSSSSGDPDLFVNTNARVMLDSSNSRCENSCSCSDTSGGSLMGVCPEFSIAQSTFFIAVSSPGPPSDNTMLTVSGTNVQTCDAIS